MLHLREALAMLATHDVRPRRPRATTTRRTRRPSRLRRTLFLTALGPASALVSMTLVRLVMASHLFAGHPPSPSPWPAPPPRVSLASQASADEPR